ncbi:hypothetical protein MLGJGCBP_00027 [Rhodococcus sp. T7]|nr:hypothetical protein MLGJGCBP_09058 [Rhodococcus sp. T7]KAF0966832.1 hypothetical protein MLGJGCBP_00027 [Rhodococcus sp. T7]
MASLSASLTARSDSLVSIENDPQRLAERRMSGSNEASTRHTGSTRAFRAGPLAGHGSVLWLLDVGRPVLVRRAGDGSTSTHTVPGAIRRSGIVGYTPRRLHADGSGCWVVGADGIAHCDHAGTVTIVDSAPVSASASALTDGVLATAAPTYRATSSSVVLRTLSGGVYATVDVPADIEAVSPGAGGFLLFMRTGAQGTIVAQNQRGPWCARVRLDGALELGTAWPRPFWNSGDTTLVDVGSPLAVGRSETRGQLLDEELRPIASVPFTSAFPPWTTDSGTWLVMRSRALAHQLQDPAFAAGYDGAYVGVRSRRTATPVARRPHPDGIDTPRHPGVRRCTPSPGEGTGPLRVDLGLMAGTELRASPKRAGVKPTLAQPSVRDRSLGHHGCVAKRLGGAFSFCPRTVRLRCRWSGRSRSVVRRRRCRSRRRASGRSRRR